LPFNPLRDAIFTKNGKYKILVFSAQACFLCRQFQKPETKKFMSKKSNMALADVFELAMEDHYAEEFFTRYGIYKLPAVIIMDSGKVLFQLEGVVGAETMEQIIKDSIASK
jgi:thioredoxin-related protein